MLSKSIEKQIDNVQRCIIKTYDKWEKMLINWRIGIHFGLSNKKSREKDVKADRGTYQKKLSLGIQKR